MGAKLRPAAERAGQEVLLVNRRQHLSRTALVRPVRNGWHPKRALPSYRAWGCKLAVLPARDILAVNGLEHRLYPLSKALLRRLHRLTIYPGGRALRHPEQTPLHPFARDMMGKRLKAEFRLSLLYVQVLFPWSANLPFA